MFLHYAVTATESITNPALKDLRICVSVRVFVCFCLCMFVILCVNVCKFVCECV